MKLSQQVCSLEQAKRLKELGVSDRLTKYGYIEIPDNGLSVKAYWQDDKHALIDANIIMYVGNGERKWAAPNVAELGAMFGRGTKATEKLYDAVLERLNSGNSFHIAYSPQFLANCLIGAIEQGWTTPDEVNKRLAD